MPVKSPTRTGAGGVTGVDPGADSALRERIARKAYDLYQQRGWTDGHDLEDWLEAERIVLAEVGASSRTEVEVARARKTPRTQAGSTMRHSSRLGS